jgi:tetratricopeptide (TPR) repeat protein
VAARIRDALTGFSLDAVYSPSTRTGARLVVVAVVSVALAVATAPAIADEAPPTREAREAREARARSHFDVGLGAYRVGQYEVAAREFLAAYGVLPLPAFLLNIGQAYRGLGDLEKASQYYAQFLATAPAEDPNRAQAERLQRELEEALAARRAAAAARAAAEPVAVAAPKPAPPSTNRAQRAAGLALVGVGVAVLAVGAGLLGAAARIDGEIAAPPPGTISDPAVFDRRESFASGGFASIGVAGQHLSSAHHDAALVSRGRRALRRFRDRRFQSVGRGGDDPARHRLDERDRRQRHARAARRRAARRYQRPRAPHPPLPVAACARGAGARARDDGALSLQRTDLVRRASDAQYVIVVGDSMRRYALSEGNNNGDAYDYSSSLPTTEGVWDCIELIIDDAGHLTLRVNDQLVVDAQSVLSHTFDELGVGVARAGPGTDVTIDDVAFSTKPIGCPAVGSR